jgi:transposase
VRAAHDPSILRFVDSCFVKCSITAMTGRCSEFERVTGRTKGGNTTKVTVMCDADMRVHQCRIDPGNCSDHTAGANLPLPGQDKIIVADKGYSSQALRQHIEKAGHRHCIAKQKNDTQPHSFNRQYYRKRHKVENDFAKMKRWTRLELRRERGPKRFESFVCLWAVGTWVKF